MTLLLEADDLCVNGADVFSLRVRRGEIVGLLGRNGAGKSRTLRMLAGLASARSARIRIDDARAKRGLAFVPQGARRSTA